MIHVWHSYFETNNTNFVLGASIQIGYECNRHQQNRFDKGETLLIIITSLQNATLTDEARVHTNSKIRLLVDLKILSPSYFLELFAATFEQILSSHIYFLKLYFCLERKYLYFFFSGICILRVTMHIRITRYPMTLSTMHTTFH